MGFLTDSIHAGQPPDPETGAVMTPIYQTSTYAQSDPDSEVKYDYSRVINPTRTALESNIAMLENGQFGTSFGSGMAAIAAVVKLLSSGDHILVTENVYGGTYRYLNKVASRHGISCGYIDTSNPDEVKKAGKSETRMILIETPTNPMLTVTDIRTVVNIARAHDWITVVDNTFLSPYFQRPLTLGSDLVVHSATKYLSGHSDVVLGIVVTNDEKLDEELKFLQKSEGAIPGPFDCWLILRSTKTLGLRMRQHDKSARAIAELLSDQPKVEKVNYPGLRNHPQHSLAKEQQLDPDGNPGFGGMISIEMGNFESAKSFVRNLDIFTLAESLGGVESLISHPASMTHASVPKDTRLRFGITDGLVRLSVGCEDTADLIGDLKNTLDKL